LQLYVYANSYLNGHVMSWMNFPPNCKGQFFLELSLLLSFKINCYHTHYDPHFIKFSLMKLDRLFLPIIRLIAFMLFLSCCVNEGIQFIKIKKKKITKGNTLPR